MNIQFIPVNRANAKTYITVGIRSYTQHYLHLWENRDPSPFINKFLSQKNLAADLKKPLQHFFIIKNGDKAVGILNFSLDAHHTALNVDKTVLLNKLYLIRSAANKGIGAIGLNFVEAFAKKHRKKVVWLYAMQKGRPKHFYQKNGYEIITASEITLTKVLEEEKHMWLMAKYLD